MQKAWECEACGGRSYTRINANTIMCDYCETKFIIADEKKETSSESSELRRARVMSLLAEADALHAKDQPREEIPLLTKALEIDENFADTWIKLGRAYRQSGMNDEALRCYKKVLDLDPSNGMVYTNVGVVYYMKGEYAEAVRYHKMSASRIGTGHPEYPLLLANMALATYKNGDRAEGIRLLEEAERRGYPNAAKARAELGISAPASDAGTKERKSRAAALTAQAKVLHNQNKTEEGIPLLNEAIQLDPENSDAWTVLGRAYRLTGLNDDALRCYERALELDPKNGSAYGNIGVVHYMKGNYTEAIRRYRQALSMLDRSSGDYPIMQANLAMATYKSGDKRTAIRLLDEAERMGYKNAENARKQLGITKADRFWSKF